MPASTSSSASKKKQDYASLLDFLTEDIYSDLAADRHDSLFKLLRRLGLFDPDETTDQLITLILLLATEGTEGTLAMTPAAKNLFMKTYTRKWFAQSKTKETEMWARPDIKTLPKTPLELQAGNVDVFNLAFPDLANHPPVKCRWSRTTIAQLLEGSWTRLHTESKKALAKASAASNVLALTSTQNETQAAMARMPMIMNMAMVAIQALAKQQNAPPRNPIEEILTMNPTQQRGIVQRLRTLHNLDQTAPSQSSPAGGVSIEEVTEESTSNGGKGVEAKASTAALPEAAAAAETPEVATPAEVAAPESDGTKEKPKHIQATPLDAANAVLDAMRARKDGQAKRKATEAQTKAKAAAEAEAKAKAAADATAAAPSAAASKAPSDSMKRPSADPSAPPPEPASKKCRMETGAILKAMCINHEKSIQQYLFRAPSAKSGGPGTKARMGNIYIYTPPSRLTRRSRDCRGPWAHA